MEYMAQRPTTHYMDGQVSATAHLREANPKILEQTTANTNNNTTTRVERPLPSLQNVTTNTTPMDTKVAILLDTDRKAFGPLENLNDGRVPAMWQRQNPPLSRNKMPTRTSETNLGGSNKQT
jgi:hypothetical protein